MALTFDFVSKMAVAGAGSQDVFVVCDESLSTLAELTTELVESSAATDPFGLGGQRSCRLQDGASPSLLPGWEGTGYLPEALSASKVVVFCADPRLSARGSSDSVGAMRDYIDCMAQWAELENSCPEQVRVFLVEHFESDAESAVRSLSQFLGVGASSSKVLGQMGDAWVEAAQRISEAQRDLEQDARSKAQELFEPWLQSANPFLQDMGERLSHEVAQIEVATGRDWSAEHALGTCNPCIFAMRNTCRNGSACQHCHLAGHAKPKRASKKKRDQKKERLARLCRTPSPEWRSYDEAPRSLPTMVLPTQPVMQPVLAAPAFFAIPVYCN
jgi:hypothetical protein